MALPLLRASAASRDRSNPSRGQDGARRSSGSRHRFHGQQETTALSSPQSQKFGTRARNSEKLRPCSSTSSSAQTTHGSIRSAAFRRACRRRTPRRRLGRRRRSPARSSPPLELGLREPRRRRCDSATGGRRKHGRAPTVFGDALDEVVVARGAVEREHRLELGVVHLPQVSRLVPRTAKSERSSSGVTTAASSSRSGKTSRRTPSAAYAGDHFVVHASSSTGSGS